MPARRDRFALRFRWVLAGLLTIPWLANMDMVLAQGNSPRLEIWDVAIGTPAADISALAFQEYACGTNGGPPGKPLKSFAEFKQCTPEANGLREVFFRYDDEAEYVARARRLDDVAERLQGNKVLGTPSITSLLLDEDGIIRGLRAVTDPRASLRERADAYKYRYNFKARFGLDGWSCVERKPGERRSPVGGSFVDESCEKRTDAFRIVVEGHHYRKMGQYAFDRRTGEATPGRFESSARLEVYQLQFGQDAAVERSPEVGEAAGAKPAPAPYNVERSKTALNEAFLAGRTKDCAGCDLGGAWLKRRDLAGANLAGANLRGAILHRADLSGADLSGANLKDANLNKADLQKADLTAADLEGAFLYQADLSAAELEGTVLSSARLQHARLVRAKLRGAVLETVFATGARFADADLMGATLDGSLFDTADFQRADLTGADLRGSLFIEARFTNANLTRTLADQTDFLEADFKDAILTDAEWRNSRLTRAVTSGADLSTVELSGSILPDGRSAP